ACVGGCESERRTAPVGGPAFEPALATPSPTAATAAIDTAALPKRRARRLIEEVQVLRVDRDGHLVAELQLHVRRERRDEVRARADDDSLRLRRQHLLLLGLLRLDRARVDLEVRHRLAAERLD